MGNKFKNERYLNIPYSILFNNELDAENKLILADIYSLSHLPKGCYKSQTGFGSFLMSLSCRFRMGPSPSLIDLNSLLDDSNYI